jgi:SEN1 N terminal
LKYWLVTAINLVAEPHPMLQDVHDIIAKQLAGCIGCIKNYYSIREAFFADYASREQASALLDKFKKQLHRWDVSRHVSILKDFKQKLDLCTPQEAKAFRKTSLYIIFEVSRF